MDINQFSKKITGFHQIKQENESIFLFDLMKSRYFFRELIYINAFNRMEINLLFQCDWLCFFFCFFLSKLFALWILLTMSSWPGFRLFNILFLNILSVLLEIIPNSRFTGLNNIYSSLIEYPIYKALRHIFSLTKATSSKHTRMYEQNK